MAESLRQAEASTGLPVAQLLPEDGRVFVRFHEDASLALAYPVSRSPDHGPLLSLAGRAYLDGWGLRPLADLTVDAADYLLYTLTTIWLEERSRAAPELAAELAVRAGNAFPTAPPGSRVEAYVDALASFAARAIALRLVLDRLAARRLGQGRTVCPELREEGPLFRLWRSAFGPEPYPGRYWREGPPGGGEVVYTAETLSAADKRWALEILGLPWTGDPQADLGPRFCPP